MYSTDDVNPPGGERLWRGHAMQLLWGSVYEVTMDLAAMASCRHPILTARKMVDPLGSSLEPWNDSLSLKPFLNLT